MASAVRQTITDAIRDGVPLYNAGQPDRCRQRYLDAALKCLDCKDATEAELQVLRNAAEQAANLPGSEGAWALRHAFDSILDGSAAAAARFACLPAGTSDYMILDFERGVPAVPRWFVMDDTVMGGVSSSTLQYDSTDQAAVFTGNVSTGNGGGFASVRAQPVLMGPAKGLRLLVKGDGRRYKLNAKADSDMDGVMYQQDFATTEGTWQTVDLPLTAFKPNFRGRMLPDRPPLRGEAVRQLGLMVSKFSDTGGATVGFRAGRFRLAIKWIKGFM